jgi:immune inhibitor A
MKTSRCLVLAILLLVVAACLLAACGLVGGLAAWGALRSPAPPIDLPDPSVPPAPSTAAPAPNLPPARPPQPVALQTETRLNVAVVPIHDPVELYAVLAERFTPPAAPAPPQPYKVGDRRRFQLDSPGVEAELVHVTAHTYTWLVLGTEADREALIAAADRFEAEIYPSVRRYFGSEWSPGVDGDVHLSILHYRDPDDGAAGYFAPYDELPGWIVPQSNETEMIYVNLDSMEPGDDYYFAVLAHEFEHMIHWQNDRNESDWLDEALAELACRVAGLDPGDSDQEFLQEPDTQLNRWPDDGDTAVHYGAGYLFALYLWERFGDGLIWDLAHRPADGLAALDAVLSARGTGLTADDVFADWVIVNAVDEGEYACIHEDHRGQLYVDGFHDRYPASESATVYPYATDYVELEGQGTLQLRFQGATEASLLPVSPHSGETFWWSNRGNRSDARLIRRFDLAGLSSATLRFWTWYDLESGYDFAYVSASDDGETWRVLRGTSAGQQGDYGWAYSGASGGWVEEEIDLSPYAGKEIWVRFDYATDDSINGAGFLLDDVAIPELGLADPCEEVGDWQAQGFVLVGTTVPLRWLVQSIEFPRDGPVLVRRMRLDERQAGQLELTLEEGDRNPLLAISALVRGTSTPATYQYEVTAK